MSSASKTVSVSRRSRPIPIRSSSMCRGRPSSFTSATASPLTQTMRATGISKPTVWRWRDRFLAEGVDGLLYDIPRRRGRKPISEEKVSELIALAMSPPPEHASHWTLRALATKVGDRRLDGIRHPEEPWPQAPQGQTFKVSRDPRFALKVRDVVGLYINPPDHAVVISVDEKTQIQALGRTQAPLPMKPGHPETRTHDDKRNGTTCLMAALDVATGTVTGQMVARHRSEEFLAFLEFVSEGIEPGTRFTSSSTTFPLTSRPRSTNG